MWKMSDAWERFRSRTVPICCGGGLMGWWGCEGVRVGRMQLMRREIKGKIESGEHAVASHKIPLASNQHGCTDTASMYWDSQFRQIWQGGTKPSLLNPKPIYGDDSQRGTMCFREPVLVRRGDGMQRRDSESEKRQPSRHLWPGCHMSHLLRVYPCKNCALCNHRSIPTVGQFASG